MIIDCFPYFNERELLELRIRTLENFVDGFLIIDANRTHRGEEKPFTCVNTLKELGISDENIQVLHVELPSKEEVYDPWIRERAQRDALSVGLHMLPDDTIFICSDCDEIINPDKLNLLVENVKQKNSLVRPSMSMHYGRADRQLITPDGELFEWRNAFMCTVNFSKQHSTLSSLRSSQDNLYVGDRDCGWHFSWMGNSDRRLKKLKSYAHWETDKPDVERICKTFKATPGNVDMLGRQDHLITTYPLDSLPKKLFELDRVKNYLLPNYVD
jgi:beta-1,4-mannosyl-glycoprotein beta-1,4-N-acetylglucosaminyltransferase